jgi:hypothetical protein
MSTTFVPEHSPSTDVMFPRFVSASFLDAVHFAFVHLKFLTL